MCSCYNNNIYYTAIYCHITGHFATAATSATGTAAGSGSGVIQLDLTGGMLQGSSAQQHYSADYVAQGEGEEIDL